MCIRDRDIHLFDKLAHFDRERIPERVVHAKGAGAWGYFEAVSYTHLRAHETVLDLVCRLLLETKTQHDGDIITHLLQT